MKIVVLALAKSGSTFAASLLRNISKRSRWDRNDEFDNEYLICGPRLYGFPRCDDAFYIIQYRSPLDNIVSHYYSIVWHHPYISGQLRKADWDAQRARAQKLTIDEWCLWRVSSLVQEYEELIEIATKYNALQVTYETMWNDFDTWINTFLQPFDLSTTEQHEIIEHQRTKVRKEPGHTARFKGWKLLRHGEPGEHLLKLKPSTVEYLRHEFRFIIKHIQSLNPRHEY